MLISVKELAGRLSEKDLIIIDCRSYKEYSEGHIPGAVNLDLFAFHWFDTSESGIEGFDAQTRQIFSFVGVTNNKMVVFYDGISGMLAARGVWMLLYFSHKNVAMLDGGLKKWQAEGLEIQTKTNGYSPAKFDGKPNSNLLASYEYIKKNLGKLILIDARSREEYSGDVIRGSRRGHIPGAINVDFNLNISDDGTFKEEGSLSALYKIPKDSQIVTYCQGAYRAANSFVALKKLGFENVRVYLGSWGEWSNRIELPVE
ncbi:MAG: sulfurtransferase [Candidatus Nitrosotenuis sp.]|nr:sulfurtransferase [Candidatus Nitrosotenuis sp.]